MVGDYTSTSIVPSTHVALPVFEVAFAPGSGTSCSPDTTGKMAGQACNEATYTTAEQVVKGGDNEATAAETDPTRAGVGAVAPADRQSSMHVRGTHR